MEKLKSKRIPYSILKCSPSGSFNSLNFVKYALKPLILDPNKYSFQRRRKISLILMFIDMMLSIHNRLFSVFAILNNQMRKIMHRIIKCYDPPSIDQDSAVSRTRSSPEFFASQHVFSSIIWELKHSLSSLLTCIVYLRIVMTFLTNLWILIKESASGG